MSYTTILNHIICNSTGFVFYKKTSNLAHFTKINLTKMNKVLKYLTLYDIFFLGGFGLLSPIFAIYINDKISGGSILAAGTSVTIYVLTKAIIQIPTSKYTDRENGNKREFYTMLTGSIIIALVPLFYLGARNIMEIYLIQFIFGIGHGLSYPGWMTIFSRFIEKGKEGYGWSSYNTYVTLATASTAMIGGYIAQNFGFRLVFISLFIFIIISIILTLKMHKHITKKE